MLDIFNEFNSVWWYCYYMHLKFLYVEILLADQTRVSHIHRNFKRRRHSMKYWILPNKYSILYVEVPAEAFFSASCDWILPCMWISRYTGEDVACFWTMKPMQLNRFTSIVLSVIFGKPKLLIFVSRMWCLSVSCLSSVCSHSVDITTTACPSSGYLMIQSLQLLIL